MHPKRKYLRINSDIIDMKKENNKLNQMAEVQFQKSNYVFGLYFHLLFLFFVFIF